MPRRARRRRTRTTWTAGGSASGAGSLRERPPASHLLNGGSAPEPPPTTTTTAHPTTPSVRPERSEAESKGPSAFLVLALLALTTACARDELAHGLEESQANQVLVALDEGGIRGEKRADERGEGVWRVDVAGADAARAQRILAERELPRLRAAGFGEVFGKGSVVPSPTEERALYLHALSGELARSVEAIDGVVEARVHLALAEQDPLRGGIPPASRAAVLVKARPGARGRVEPLAGGIAALVAGGVAGLDAGAVAVVVTEAAPIAGAPPVPVPRTRAALLLAAAAAAAAAVALLARTTLARVDVAALVREWRGAGR
jgi:type III secretion protein J